ncbi:hypothetical protein NPIL_312851 [Nephila pilipes]|uniref:Uncharacterized protein n=1 Tax=Nephila pilipes TaxID=299642 RepID=A0A8X6JAB3_NEPPI|nr:hypothetical protein NPIL_312851 [Nephila pilipes]
MANAIALIFDISLYLLHWILFRCDVPSLLEIITYSFFVELLEMGCLPDFPIRHLTECRFTELQDKFLEDKVPVVSSVSENLIPHKDTFALNSLEQSQINVDPIVHSEASFTIVFVRR